MPISKSRTKKSRQELFWWRRPSKKVADIRKRRNVEKIAKGLNKRRKFVLVSVILTSLMFVVQRLPVEIRTYVIIGMGAVSYLLSMWALRKDLVGIAWIVDLILPVLYPVAIAMFYFLLPQQAVTRVFVLVIFAISMYALLLTANIFAVATNRTIQLLRAARTVGFLLSVLTAAFMFHVIFSFNLSFWLVTSLCTLVSFPIFLQGLWSYTLEKKLGQRELIYALVGSVVVLEVSLGISFWSIEPLMASVLLSMIIYVVLGLFQHDLDKRLFDKTIQEYLGFALIVLMIVVGTVILRWMA